MTKKALLSHGPCVVGFLFPSCRLEYWFQNLTEVRSRCVQEIQESNIQYWEISLNVLKWNTECLLISFSALGQAIKWMSCTNYCGHHIAGQLGNDVAADDTCLLPKDNWHFYPYIFANILPECGNTLHKLKNLRFLYKSVLSDCLPKKGLYYSLWETSIFDQKCLTWIKCPNFKEYAWFSISSSSKSPGKLIKRFWCTKHIF